MYGYSWSTGGVNRCGCIQLGICPFPCRDFILLTMHLMLALKFGNDQQMLAFLYDLHALVIEGEYCYQSPFGLGGENFF